MSLPQGQLGYAIELERRTALEMHGDEPREMLARMRDEFPAFNTQAMPTDVFDILDQGQQGACQGHALAAIFSICFFLATGRREAFSRACGYYVAQQFDGIRGDTGSTLSAGQKVAMQHGMCLEKDWPYPRSYNPNSKPNGVTFPFKLSVSKPFNSAEEMEEWLQAGLPIQTGISWNNSCNKEIVDNWQAGGGGGHSTCLWQLRPNGNGVNINSWGSTWNGDGCHEWTWDSIRKMVRHSWSTFIGYAPTRMSFPEQVSVQ